MNIHKEVEQLQQEIEKGFPATKTEITLFPSGAAMLDVHIGKEIYVLEYYLDVGVGIGRASAATFGWEGFQKPFPNFEQAKEHMFSLLKQNGKNW